MLERLFESNSSSLEDILKYVPPNELFLEMACKKHNAKLIKKH